MSNGHNFGDRDVDITRPETHLAILERLADTMEVLAGRLRTSIPLLGKIRGSEREYLVQALADVCLELRELTNSLEPALRKLERE